MADAMVTGRMSEEKKAAGNAVLGQAGLNASQAINLFYDRIIEDRNTDFFYEREIEPHEWEAAAKLIDSIYLPVDPRFETMTRGEIKLERARSRGVI